MIAALAAVICVGVGDATRRSSGRVSPPTKYFCTTPIGTMTWSSGSWKPVPPLAWRMPITRNGRPPIEICEPMSLAPSPRVVGGGGAEDGDAQVLVEADVGQERALPDVVGADRRVGRGRADDRRGRRSRSPAVTVRLVEISGATPPIAGERRDRVGVVEGQGRVPSRRHRSG